METVVGYTCCAWAGGTCVNYPDFFENNQFHVTDRQTDRQTSEIDSKVIFMGHEIVKLL